MNKILKTLESEGLLHGGPGRGRFVSDYSEKRTGVVEVVLADDESISRFTPILDSMRESLSKAGLTMRICSLNHKWGAYETGMTEKYLNIINPDSIDGCILLTQAAQLETALALAFRKPVLWFHHPSVRPGLTGLRFDFAGGAFKAVRYLAQLGHKHIGFAGVHERYVSGREQAIGIRLALETCPGVTVTQATGKGWGEDEGRTLTRRLLDGENPPAALLYSLDAYLLGGLRELKERKLSIPGDISVIGWNDSVHGPAAPVPLTSVRMDHAEAGRMAVERLLKQMANPDQETAGALVPAELIVRDSTAKPAAAKNTETINR
jgi:LacI family transcriptional regulator